MINVRTMRDGRYVVVEDGHTAIAGPFEEAIEAHRYALAHEGLRFLAKRRIRISWSEPGDPDAFDG